MLSQDALLIYVILVYNFWYCQLDFLMISSHQCYQNVIAFINKNISICCVAIAFYLHVHCYYPSMVPILKIIVSILVSYELISVRGRDDTGISPFFFGIFRYRPGPNPENHQKRISIPTPNGFWYHFLIPGRRRDPDRDFYFQNAPSAKENKDRPKP